MRCSGTVMGATLLAMLAAYEMHTASDNEETGCIDQMLTSMQVVGKTLYSPENSGSD